MLGGRADYEFRDAAGHHWFCEEPDLRKRRDPPSTWEDIEAITGWSPMDTVDPC